MCDAVSACRARRKSNSLAVLPGGCFSAASLNLIASSASRSSKVVVCVTRVTQNQQASVIFQFGHQHLHFEKEHIANIEQRWYMVPIRRRIQNLSPPVCPARESPP